MFSSFFPNPKILFPAAILWTAICMTAWYGFARDLGLTLSVGNLIGLPYPPLDAKGGDVPTEVARNVWAYQYMIVAGILFLAATGLRHRNRWFWWSVGVSAVIVFFLWFRVQLDVMINNWFGAFYNTIQQALGKPGAVTQEQLFILLVTFGVIALVAITTSVLTEFVTSHYIFRWRTAKIGRAHV